MFEIDFLTKNLFLRVAAAERKCWFEENFSRMRRKFERNMKKNLAGLDKIWAKFEHY